MVAQAEVRRTTTMTKIREGLTLIGAVVGSVAEKGEMTR